MKGLGCNSVSLFLRHAILPESDVTLDQDWAVKTSVERKRVSRNSTWPPLCDEVGSLLDFWRFPVSAFFDLPSFFRRVSNPLLQRFFSTTPAFHDFDWASVSARNTEPILQRFNAMSTEPRQAAFQVFRRADSLASSMGTQYLIEACREKDDGVAVKLASMRNAHDRAFWMCLEHPDVIDSARILSRIASFSKRMWEPRQGLPVRQLDVTSEMKSELGRQITELFQPEQCRGEHCVVEHVRREGGIECFFAYPADYTDEREGYDLEGHFERTSWNPAFKILFAYHSADGTLDIYAPGGTKLRSRLANGFARAVLGSDLELTLPELDCFDLEILKDPNLTFRTNAADRIGIVRIQSLKLKFHGNKPSVIEVSIDGRRRDGCIHEVIAAKFRDAHVTLAGATVACAVLQAFVQTSTGKEHSISFRLSAPSFCDLEDSPEEQALRGYLREWGIEKNANSLAEAA